MANVTIADLINNTSSKEVFTLESLMRKPEFAELGSNKGFGFSFAEGEKVSFPKEAEMQFRVRSITLGGKATPLLYVAAQRGSSWDWVPVWALRKRPASEDDLTSPCKSNELYMNLTHAENDIARCKMIAGSGFTVAVSNITQLNPKTGKEYDIKVFLLNKLRK